jgi:hypothetical protein
MTIILGNTPSNTILPSDMIYERTASTLGAPVPAGSKLYQLFSWSKSPTRGNVLLLGLGNDQHDNSYYQWVVDGTILPISGAARVGSITQPYIFPIPIIVKSSVQLYVTNSNAVNYPNNGLDPASQVPYECVMIARWV